MPELPEVETVARLVRPALVGRTITRVHAEWERSLGGVSRRRFGAAVRGARLRAVGRRAKYVVIDLERGGRPHGAILVHLRMSGRLHVDDLESEERPYTRVACDLDDGYQLRFIDVRKFGRFVHRLDPSEILGPLGPEPLEPGFDGPWLFRELRARRRLRKPLLLDQTFVAGLGNIYVDESLHTARLHPLTPSDRVSRTKAHALAEAIQDTLAEAIRREGSSFDRFYRTPEGQPGSYQDQFRVYGRDGKPCPVCARPIAKLVVGQRGTHLCTRCQPKPRRRD